MRSVLVSGPADEAAALACALRRQGFATFGLDLPPRLGTGAPPASAPGSAPSTATCSSHRPPASGRLADPLPAPAGRGGLRGVAAAGPRRHRPHGGRRLRPPPPRRPAAHGRGGPQRRRGVPAQRRRPRRAAVGLRHGRRHPPPGGQQQVPALAGRVRPRAVLRRLAQRDLQPHRPGRRHPPGVAPRRAGLQRDRRGFALIDLDVH